MPGFKTMVEESLNMLTCLDFINELSEIYRQESLAFEKGVPKSQVKPIKELTKREREVYSLLILGESYEKIAEKLYISKSTVHSHINSIYTKFNVRSRRELQERYGE
jgi:DNA-binding NarL/FixJ family response regulator